MNVLFFTHGKVCSTEGGTERTTITIATNLREIYGCRCYSLYESTLDTPKEDCFEEEFFWTFNENRTASIIQLRELVKDCKIDIIVNQGSFQHTKYIHKAIEGLSCFLVFAHHFEPSAEKKYYSWNYFINQPIPRTVKGLIYYVYKLCLFPWIQKKQISQLALWYKESYEFADRVILLSDSFVTAFCKFARISNPEKIEIIPNGLSFKEFFDKHELSQKGKIVLIVARLDEKFKNILLALKIWDMVKRYRNTNGWSLKVVGHGPDYEKYQRIITSNKIPNVTLEGRQNPIPYYKKASLFLMTSKSESWGLTLTEAMQFGVVPIALNTYSSLSNIITNNYDGIIVQPNEINNFGNQILKLIDDNSLRNEMAINAIESSKRFSQDIIAKKWYNLFQNLLDSRYD